MASKIKNSNSVENFKIKLMMSKNDESMNLCGYFGELSDKLLNIFWCAYIDIVL